MKPSRGMGGIKPSTYNKQKVKKKKLYTNKREIENLPGIDTLNRGKLV
tara:strand:- start:13812 stop:13955 length:144 start_codon:yes stop_codon:yes gene_type:complete